MRFSAIKILFKKKQLFQKLRLIVFFFLRRTVNFFQFLRLTTKFLAVLRLTVNPIETLNDFT